MIANSTYRTNNGIAYNEDFEAFLETVDGRSMRGRVDLLFTSPPFPLSSKKAYGNLEGDSYVEWLASLMAKATSLLAPNGSLVIEIGNSWDSGQPTMSLLPLKALMAIVEASGFFVCQQFVCNNPSRLPGPAQWVTVNRWRVKDTYTHVWWLARHPLTTSDNRRVLDEYSPSMKRLIKTRKFNAGVRPSGHVVSAASFATDHGGAIPSNVLSYPNTADLPSYRAWCKHMGLPLHPARMQQRLADFFVRFLTVPGDLVLDCFAGSNTTGSVAESLGRRWVAVEQKDEYLLGSLGRFVDMGPKVQPMSPDFVDAVVALRQFDSKQTRVPVEV